jgi:hypothetical protein
MLRDGDPVAEHNSWYVNPCWGGWAGWGPMQGREGGRVLRGTRVGGEFFGRLGSIINHPKIGSHREGLTNFGRG